MLYLAGIVLTFFLVVLLVTKKGKTTADRILAIWLVVIGLHLFFVFLSFTDNVLSFPYLLGFNFPLPLLHGPFLYLYTGSVTSQIVDSKHRLVHFLPFLSAYILLLPFFLLPLEQRVLVFRNEGMGYEAQMLVLIVLIMTSGVVYVALSLWLLRNHKKSVQDQFSSIEKVNLAWLRYLIYGIGIIWLFVLFGNDIMIFNAVVVFVFFLGYFGIRQVGIFTQNYPTEINSVFNEEATTKVRESLEANLPTVSKIPILIDEPKKIKYLRSSLSEALGVEIFTSLTKVITEDKIFINPELTLAELAKTLNVHPHNLSQVINTFEGKNFYDYINLKRIEEFKRVVALPENRKFTLLALAHDCGFNSKTSFNRNFKNLTGLSPSEYLRQTHIKLEQ